jgi:tetratricopeptide (TPR) repeat protein
MTSSNHTVDEIQQLQYEVVSSMEADAIYACHDEKFVYIACRDNRIRVWSKANWKLETVLGETSSLPLRVQVDDEQVYVTCEKRLYVWNKQSWGMIGWFDLSYQALNSILSTNKIIVGAKDGRLLSIMKDTHETSSWQLYKSDIIALWKDGEILVTVPRKDETKAWIFPADKAPTELAKLHGNDRAIAVSGNDSSVILGQNNGNVSVFDRIDWTQKMTLNPIEAGHIVTVWSNMNYVIAAYESGILMFWDARKGIPIGYIEFKDTEIEWIVVDNSILYIMTPDRVDAISIHFEGQPFDLSNDDDVLYDSGILKSTPYDVLETILELQKKGDQFLRDGDFKAAVTEYETALQNLIDNNHALLELPTERDRLTTDINSRLGKALLKSKILEVQELNESVVALHEALKSTDKAEIDDEEVKQSWDSVVRSLRESRVLSEAQADNVLSYQLSEICDELESTFNEAKNEYDKYQERINLAQSFTSSIMSEWRWLERRRTNLDERKSFLETTLKDLDSRIKNKEKFQRLLEQISRILSASDDEIDEVLLDSEDAEKAITSMLKILPKKVNELKAISELSEWKVEKERMLEALQQALDTTTKHKLKDLLSQVEDAISTVEGLKFSSGQ